MIAYDIYTVLKKNKNKSTFGGISQISQLALLFFFLKVWPRKIAQSKSDEETKVSGTKTFDWKCD